MYDKIIEFEGVSLKHGLTPFALCRPPSTQCGRRGRRPAGMADWNFPLVLTVTGLLVPAVRWPSGLMATTE
jgi:hypothetical protein